MSPIKKQVPAKIPSKAPAKASAKGRILDVAVNVIRGKGYSATTVDDLCSAAGVTKGAFFHHFESKEALAVAAAAHWTEVTGALFENAPYHLPDNAADRVFAYLDFRASLLEGEIAEYTCLVGTMVQEVHESSPEIRDACSRSITSHAETLEPDFAEALASSSNGKNVNARTLALHTQAVLQGAFILAKATQDVGAAVASIGHLRAYCEFLFDRSTSERRTLSPTLQEQS